MYYVRGKIFAKPNTYPTAVPLGTGWGSIDIRAVDRIIRCRSAGSSCRLVAFNGFRRLVVVSVGGSVRPTIMVYSYSVL